MLARCSVPQLAIWTRTTAAAHCNQSRTANSRRGRGRGRRSWSGSWGNCLGIGKCKLRYDHNDQLAHVVIPTKINQASFKNWRKDELKRLSKSPKTSTNRHADSSTGQQRELSRCLVVVCIAAWLSCIIVVIGVLPLQLHDSIFPFDNRHRSRVGGGGGELARECTIPATVDQLLLLHEVCSTLITMLHSRCIS